MITETTPSREAALTGRLAFLNTGTGTAEVRIYGGTRPTLASDPPTSAMIVAIPLENPAGTVASGALTLLPAEPGMITTSGVATWARVVNRDAATAFDMAAGAEGSGAECELSDTTLWAGGSVAITSAVLG